MLATASISTGFLTCPSPRLVSPRKEDILSMKPLKPVPRQFLSLVRLRAFTLPVSQHVTLATRVNVGVWLMGRAENEEAGLKSGHNRSRILFSISKMVPTARGRKIKKQSIVSRFRSSGFKFQEQTRSGPTCGTQPSAEPVLTLRD